MNILWVMVLLVALLMSTAQARDLPYGETAPAERSSSKVHIEETGSGKVERHYDAKGNLAEVTFFDYSVDPPQVERLLIHGADRVRTTERGRVLLRRETERYGKAGELKSREVEVCAAQGKESCSPLNHKTVFEYAQGKVTVAEYELIEDRWKLKTSAQQPSL